MNMQNRKQHLIAFHKNIHSPIMWMIIQFPHGMHYKDMNIWVEVNLTFKFAKQWFTQFSAMSLLLPQQNKVAYILQILPVFKPVPRMITVLNKQDTYTNYQCKWNTEKLLSNLVISVNFTK